MPPPSPAGPFLGLAVALGLAACASQDLRGPSSSPTAGTENVPGGNGSGHVMNPAADASLHRDVDASEATGEGGEGAACPLACGEGHRCELVSVMCVRAPCPPQPTCVAAVSCDPRKVLCRRAPPVCAEGEVPSVSDSCYGPCVAIETCACSEAEECPDPDHFTCWLSAKHCGPYV